MPPARTARSSTSCPGSTRKAVRSTPSSSPRHRISTTTSCGDNLVCLPERGRIGIFNRSYYEEVLVVRVHPELLSKQQLPSQLVTKHIWKERYEDINAVERYLGRNGYVIRKFFLHLSKKEQAKRFEKRLDEPDKQWKFSLGDLHERDRWKDYQDAYEDTIRHTVDAARAVGRRAGGQEMVCAVGRGRDRHRCARRTESGLSEGHAGQARRASKGPTPAPGRGTQILIRR